MTNAREIKQTTKRGRNAIYLVGNFFGVEWRDLDPALTSDVRDATIETKGSSEKKQDG